MAKAKTGEEKPAQAGGEDNARTMMLVAYVLTWITGLIVYLTKGKEDPEVRFHAMQAVFIGIAAFVIMFVGSITIVGIFIAIPVNMLLWIYGIYIGYKAYSTGERIKVPVIGEYAEKYAAQA